MLLLGLSACGKVTSNLTDASGLPVDAIEVDALGPDAGCIPSIPELCDNGLDDDCDRNVDCADTDCGSADECLAAVCGQTVTVISPPALIPDAQGCTETVPITCTPYTSSMEISGFGTTTLPVGGLLRVCTTMEHSWMRDLQIRLTCPSGTQVLLAGSVEHVGVEAFYGMPNDNEVPPAPGIGFDYCWTPSAMRAPTIDYVNSTMVHELPAGDYQSTQSLDLLAGCPLDGSWTLSVEDGWAIDDGFVFRWWLGFAPTLAASCAR